jgi:hypothetical protein
MKGFRLNFTTFEINSRNNYAICALITNDEKHSELSQQRVAETSPINWLWHDRDSLGSGAKTKSRWEIVGGRLIRRKAVEGMFVSTKGIISWGVGDVEEQTTQPLQPLISLHYTSIVRAGAGHKQVEVRLHQFWKHVGSSEVLEQWPAPRGSR